LHIDRHQTLPSRMVSVGTSAGPPSSGPRSLGNGQILNYDGQTVNFIIGQYITGQTSGAAGLIIADSDSGAT
jgi:hypothetical protein